MTTILNGAEIRSIIGSIYTIDYAGREELTVTLTNPDEDGYRYAMLQGFDGVQIVSPNTDHHTFALNLYLEALDKREEFGINDISDLEV